MFSISIINQTRRTFVLLVLLWACANAAFAQSTIFPYQGMLTVDGVLANGQYDFRFRLFDQNLVQLATDHTYEDVVVTNGSFSVQLNFGDVFDGNPRWLEVAYRPGRSTSAFIVYVPNQPVTTAPYAIRSLKAAVADTAAAAVDANKLGGVVAAQYVQTNDPRLSDARAPVAGSPNYIQNGIAPQQANLSITGLGAAGTLSANQSVNAGTQFNLGFARFLSAPGVANTFAGLGSGLANTAGTYNSFFGSFAGSANTSGSSNSFFGSNAGNVNQSGHHNAFFGTAAGQANNTGIANAFFGAAAGLLNTTGSFNSFFGEGIAFNNTTGGSNTFVGYNAGFTNKTGNNNTLIGAGTDVAVRPDEYPISYSTAIGAGAVAETDHTIVLGRSAGQEVVHIPGALTVGGQAHFEDSVVFQKGVFIDDTGGGGSIPLCRGLGAISGKVAVCSSSIRYKENVQNFKGGLDVLSRLRPVTFDWKSGGQHDLGFVAEEVNAVEPLLTVYNKDGQIEGVKYAQISAVLVNAVKEQQEQLRQQQEQLKQQQSMLATLKALVCSSQPAASVCQPQQ